MSEDPSMGAPEGPGDRDGTRVASGSLRRGRWGRLGRGGAFLAGAVVSSVLTASLVLAGAAADFTDVPASHPFFDEISEVAGACVAGGYADGTYRPADPVTRQAMAAFLSRSFARPLAGVALGDPIITLGAASPGVDSAQVLSVTLTIPDLPGNCTVPVEVRSSLSVYSNDTQANTCHGSGVCAVTAVIVAGAGEVSSSTVTESLAGHYERRTLTPSALVVQPDGTTRTYTVRVYAGNIQLNKATINAQRAIWVTTFPAHASGA